MRLGLHSLKLLALLSVGFLCGCMREAGESAPVIDGWKSGATHSPSYVVKPGDTLYSVAWSFGLDYRDLALNNHLNAPYRLVCGQKLNMVIASHAPRPPKSPVVGSPLQQDLVVSSKSTLKTITPLSPTPQAAKTSAKSRANAPITRWLKPARGRIIHGFSSLPFGNKGIDIQGNYLEPVIASAAGQVVYAGDGIRGYGNLIILKHNDSFLSAYAYNKTINVKEGSWVKAGQAIATMGRNDAGKVLLHFEIRRNGKPVNPLNYLSP